MEKLAVQQQARPGGAIDRLRTTPNSELERCPDSNLDSPGVKSRRKAEGLARAEGLIALASKGTRHVTDRVVDGLVVQIVEDVERLSHDFDSDGVQINRTRQSKIQSPESRTDTRIASRTNRPVGRGMPIVIQVIARQEVEWPRTVDAQDG